MTSTSQQQQFRYTQPPSKVLHIRNCPWECTDEELVELGKQFGKVVNTKCNVGANRNQAFIEFADLNQAISMISYYSSSSDPAQLRGKTVYLQYSNRQEIVHNKTSADITGNVLLVTLEGVEPHDVSIDVLHLVFSAFGFVQKIATFEKTAGFQALIQFSDQEVASTARKLETCMPSSFVGVVKLFHFVGFATYLLPERVNTCMLKITFSGHTDLNVKFQSHRSRDYTNPNLPVAPSAIDGSGQFSVGLDGTKQEQESNVLLASIENMQYLVNVDVLQTVFSSFGQVQKIAMFEKNGGTHALIQYPGPLVGSLSSYFSVPYRKLVCRLISLQQFFNAFAPFISDAQTAVVAKEALEGHCIYDGGFCKLHISYSRHTDLSVKVNNDRSRDYTSPNLFMLNTQPSVLGQQPGFIVGPHAPLYAGPQFAPAANVVNTALPTAQWGLPSAPVYQPMVHQFSNTYMPPGTLHYEMGPGPLIMQMPGPNVQPPVTGMRPNGH
ncbi:hypothetical protein IFM89_015018 [Coptis chinensis]|uniref:RRM domain-containing protein n=1 Tax=Coptis chinensis TaxID=261450 RepID=A0A835HQ26_9MAGN|nr:hypothetical protein IFM89_015018 [Coptis chinensis]